MDPWLPVTVDDGLSLFGFAIRHGGTGGLSWVLSTPLLALDMLSAEARTCSGRCYHLGRRITVPELEEEGVVALQLLLHRGPIQREQEADVRWLTACKMARHVGVPTPPRRHAEAIDDLIASHATRYARLRSRAGP